MSDQIAQLNAAAAAFVATNVELKSVLDRQSQEIKSVGTTTAETAAELAALSKRYDQAMADFNGLKKSLDGLELGLQKLSQPRSNRRVFKSVGAAVMAHPGVEEFNRGSRRDFSTGPLAEMRYENLRLRPKNVKDVTGLDDLISVVSTYHEREIFAMPIAGPDLRDFLNVVNITESAAAWARETLSDNQSAFVARDATKPESNIQFQAFNQALACIAAVLPASNIMLSDIPQSIDFIDTFMLDGLTTTRNSLILNGDGLNGNVLGLTVTPGIQPFIRGTAGATLLDNIRQASTQVQQVRGVANLCIISVEDHETLDLLKGTDDHYVWVSSQWGLNNNDSGTTPMYWRIPTVPLVEMASGEFIVADAARACKWYNSTTLGGITFHPQHSDFAAKNMTLIRAEERGLLATMRPRMVVYGQFGAVGSGSGSGS